MNKLNLEILSFLDEKLDKQKSTIRKDISILRRDFPNATPNAVAQLYAQQHNLSVRRMLDKEDKSTLPPIKIHKEKKSLPKRNTKKVEKINNIIDYHSDNYFVQKHIDELNRAYKYKCLTAVNILIRKLIENLIIDILRVRYPPTKKENKELYYDIKNKRYNDFSVVLRNLFDKRYDFGTENKLIEKLYNLTLNFKDSANDNTHSLYYIVEKQSEIDELNPKSIFHMIKILEKEVGIRK